MATLIIVHQNGKIIGKCDSRCYNATGSHCDCICGGRNHGKGIKQATKNVSDHLDEMMSEFREKIGEGIIADNNQLEIF